jgi:hypothetical protein
LVAKEGMLWGGKEGVGGGFTEEQVNVLQTGCLVILWKVESGK